MVPLMYTVALTGNIASGKSTVAGFFQAKGVSIISADKIAKEIASLNPTFSIVVEHFGPEILNSSNKIDREKLGKIIFSDKQSRLWLEELLHPLIREAILQDLQNYNSPYSIVEIPLLKDRSIYPLDRVLMVISEPQQQALRLEKRNNFSKEQSLKILKIQKENYLIQKNLADDIILNVSSLRNLEIQVGTLHLKYLNAANQNE